jgi:hypothetical protein
MAQKLIFIDDVDNVTIQIGDGKVKAPGVVEIVEDYTLLEETDEQYVENVTRTLRHVATGAVWNANIQTLKDRSAPVNEDLVAMPPFNADMLRGNEQSFIVTVASEYVASTVDNELLYTYTDFEFPADGVTYNKKDYGSAKAFNEAVKSEDRRFTIKSKKRYAKSDGHPVVKPTTFHLAYPELPYYEGEYSPRLLKDTGLNVFKFTTYDEDRDRALARVLAEKRPTLTIHCTLEDSKGVPHTATLTRTLYALMFDTTKVGEYANILGSSDETVTKETLEFEPLEVEGFDGKFTINLQQYVENHA